MAQQTVRKQVPPRNLLITLSALAVLLIVVLGFAIMQLGGSDKLSSLLQPQPKNAERPPGPVVQLEPFTVSLSGDDRATLLRVKVVLELNDWKTLESIKQHLASIQFTASSILAEQTFGSLQSSQGKQLLRARLYEAIKHSLPEGAVRAVYFRELLYE